MIETKLQEELKAKYNPEGSDLRRAQNIMLDLLIFLDKICKENNLTYWLDSGTLLGAARHGGFIPWDDDVDVCMPRKDAKKLKKIMGNKVFDGHIVLQNQSTDWNYVSCNWMRIRDLNTENIAQDNIHNAYKYKGVQIDIFEVESGVRQCMKSIITKICILMVTLPATKTKSFLIRNISNFNARVIKNIIIPICRLFKSTNTNITYAIGIPFDQVYSHKIIYPLKEIKFEKHLFLCPKDEDRYLRELYGNWNQIPSTEDIETHDVCFRFFNECKS